MNGIKEITHHFPPQFYYWFSNLKQITWHYNLCYTANLVSINKTFYTLKPPPETLGYYLYVFLYIYIHILLSDTPHKRHKILLYLSSKFYNILLALVESVILLCSFVQPIQKFSKYIEYNVFYDETHVHIKPGYECTLFYII